MKREPKKAKAAAKAKGKPAPDAGAEEAADTAA